MNDDIRLAKMLGARQAFGMVAGRCSAAEAAILRDIRDAKKYMGLSPTWNEFCEQHLHISKGHANRTIRLLNDLGPNYFTLAQLTQVSADQFRGIKPYLTEDGLEYHGEAIALTGENADRLSVAISSIHKAAAPANGREPWERKLQTLQSRLFVALRQVEYLTKQPSSAHDAGRLLSDLRFEIDRIKQACAGG